MVARSTTIEWTEHTWNPFVGCTVKSAGCTNCYAMRLAGRLEAFGQTSYSGTTKNGAWTGRVNRSSETTMRKPLGIKTPAMVFVNSMSDFWHENAKDEWRMDAIRIMERTPDHIYQVLTKRPENIAPALKRMKLKRLPANFWLGATVEDGRVAHRIDTIRDLPADTKFLSVEPLIRTFGRPDLTGIDWVIIGGESGPGARPMTVEWAREARDVSVDSGVALFFKQWGHWRNNPLRLDCPNGQIPSEYVKRVDPHGKGGGLLDGVLWRQFPKSCPDTLLAGRS